MEILMFLFKSALPMEEIGEASEIRAEKYRRVKGLLQKYYVSDRSTGHVGGVFIFDSKKSLEAFRTSELVQGTSEAYKFTEEPTIRVLEVTKKLFEKEEVPMYVMHA